MRSKMMTRWVTKWLQRHTKRLWRTLYMVSSWLMSKKSFSLSQILMKLKQYLQSLQMKTFYKLWKTESVQWLWGSEKLQLSQPAMSGFSINTCINMSISNVQQWQQVLGNDAANVCYLFWCRNIYFFIRDMWPCVYTWRENPGTEKGRALS